jgi:GT2 family glycosyltransferase
MSKNPPAAFAEPNDAPLLSIVIVNWNTRGALRDCLASLFEQSGGLPLEVIVVDNASADDSLDMLKAGFPQVRVIANLINLGFARACNQGMGAATGRLLLLLNSDTYVRDEVIARVATYLLSRPDIAMAGCQLRYPDGRIQHTAFHSLSILRSLFEDLWLYKLLPAARRADLLLGGYWQSDAEKEVGWLAGAFMMLRREVFEQTGGFAEEFFMYGEDSEWCMRIRRAGGRIMFNPLGIVYHVGSVSSDLEWTWKERLRLCHLGGLRAYARLNGRLPGLLFHLARLVGTSVRGAVYALLSGLTTDAYYKSQRQIYGWQVGFYLRAFGERYGNSAARPLKREKDSPTFAE